MGRGRDASKYRHRPLLAPTSAPARAVSSDQALATAANAIATARAPGSTTPRCVSSARYADRPCVAASEAVESAPFRAADAASASVPPFLKTSSAGSVASHIVRDPMPAPPHFVIASAKAT